MSQDNYSYTTNMRHIRKVSPLGMRVVVKLVAEADTSDAGLYLPPGAKDAMAESMLAEVIEVASATDDRTSEETNISGIPLGSNVLIRKNSGVKVPWDESLRVVDTAEVLAVVTDIDIV